MDVAIVLTGQAYLPEAWAYQRHLAARGWAARVVGSTDEARGADLAISFSLSQHRALHRLPVPAVHEYHSLSCGRWRLAKDLVKRLAAPPPVGRIFSEPHIARRMRFGAGLPSLLRPMGFDAAIAGCARIAEPDHDIVYCGTFARPGVTDTLAALGRTGWRVIAFGALDDASARARMADAGVELPGAIARDAVPAALARARFGLNVTPDLAPWNRQASVKTLEYAAAGLGIIANRYPWVEAFARDHGIAVHWLDEVLARGPEAVATLQPTPADPDRVAYLEWDRLLERAGFAEFIKRCAATCR